MALATPTAMVLELMTMGQQSAAHLGELLRAASQPVQAEHQALAVLRQGDRRGDRGRRREKEEGYGPWRYILPSRSRGRDAVQKKGAWRGGAQRGPCRHDGGRVRVEEIWAKGHQRKQAPEALLPLRVQWRGLRRDSAGAAVAGGARGVRDRLLRRAHVRSRHRRRVLATGGASAFYRHRLRLKRSWNRRYRRREQELDSAATALSRAQRP